MSKADKALASLVEQHGWAVVKVPEDDRGPGFAYSVGLYWAFGHAEIVIFGLSPELMHQVINHIGDLIEKGKAFADHDISDDILEAYEVVFRLVSERMYGEYFGAGIRFYGSRSFPVLQCVWPDFNARFPWHADAAEECRRQPLLSNENG